MKVDNNEQLEEIKKIKASILNLANKRINECLKNTYKPEQEIEYLKVINNIVSL